MPTYGCLLYFGIREQQQILIIENRFIVPYAFACVWTNCRSTFASPKHAFWTHQPLLQVSKNVILRFYFLRTGIKRSHSVSSQDYTANDSSNRCFECSKMQLFEPMCESWHCHGEQWSVFGDWFSWFLGRQLANKCLCTTKNWLFCVVLVVRLRHVQFFRRNRQSFAWKCFFKRTTFVGFGSSWNTHTVDCYLLSNSYA